MCRIRRADLDLKLQIIKVAMEKKCAKELDKSYKVTELWNK